jgi:hypothetical protein
MIRLLIRLVVLVSCSHSAGGQSLLPGIEISAAQLPEMLKSYISSLTTAPDGWNASGPLMGGIKNSTSDLK